MPLTTPERRDACEKLAGRLFVRPNLTATFDLTTLQAAVDAADDWCDSNAASFNSALPASFRTQATQAQKGMLLAIVALRKTGVID